MSIELFEHPYAEFLQAVEKPNRYTGAEHGARKKDWAAAEARVCLAFPEIYDIGMSHLGFRILYKILNDDPRTLAERCYAPWVDLWDELRRRGLPLCSLESARPLKDFDVVGFSLQFELTYTNVLGMLELGGIPLRSAARGDDDPLVLAGGPVATHAEPLAPFVDAFLIGDGEEAATEIALEWVRARRDGLGRAARLERLAQIAGVYVPSLYDTGVDPESGLEVVMAARRGSGAPFPVQRRLLEDLDRFPFPDDGPVGGPEAIFDRMSIEVARGCTEGCRFCQSGMIYRPVRERDPEKVVSTVLGALEKSGQDEVSLTALSTADVSCISPLIKKIVEKTAPERVSLGVASLRAYGLGEDLLDAMRKVRASGLTFAPEAGTQRMRDVINKNVTEAQLLETAERVFSRGFDKMKLYFICGLPTETDEDVLGIVEVGKNALAVGKRLGKRPSVTVSVSVHVPKPHTPFQWCAMDSLEQIAHKQRLLKDAARGVKGMKLRMHHSLSSVLEGVLARGDRRLGPAIERAFLRGARFDSWEEHLNLDAWQEAFEHFGVDTSAYLGTLPVGARLPWDHLDVGLADGFLAREYRKALKSRLSPPCGKVVGQFVHHTNRRDALADTKRLVCYDCGVACDMTKMREERIGFLAKMGALEPQVATPIDPQDDESRRNVPAPERIRPARAGGAAVRVRLGFEKVGPAALLGHLDLIRELPRVIRRAGVRTAYSEGYHPKAQMSFGPALALGIASLDEYVDAELLDPPAPDELVRRLNAAAAGGLRFFGGERLGPHDPGLSRVITGARYVIALAERALSDYARSASPDAGRFWRSREASEASDGRGGTERPFAAKAAIDELGGPAWLEARCRAFMDEASVPVRRDVKGIGKLVDVRSFVVALSVGGESAEAALERAGIVGRVVALDVRVRILGSGAARVAEIVEAVTGDATCPHCAVRAELLAAQGAPLDLAAHRKQPAARPAARSTPETSC